MVIYFNLFLSFYSRCPYSQYISDAFLLYAMIDQAYCTSFCLNSDNRNVMRVLSLVFYPLHDRCDAFNCKMSQH